jgi:hypothetical protein
MMPSKSLKALLFILILLLTFSMSACSPAAYRLLGVDQVEVEGNVIYTRSTEYCGYGACADGNIVYAYYASYDQGQTWKQIDPPPLKMEPYQAEADYHVSECLTDAPKTCYRIDEQEYVEASEDGGTSWSIVWQVPEGRKLYMERYSYGRVINITPYDLEIIETGEGHLVVVAMGNEGVLVRSADGVWNRYAVDTISPTPYQAETLEGVLSALLYFELPVILLIAVATFLLLTFSAWITSFLRSGWPVRKKILLSLLPGFIAVLLVAFYLSLPYIFKRVDGFGAIQYSRFMSLFFLAAKMYIGVAPLLTYVWTWTNVLSLPSNPKLGLWAFLTSITLPLLLGIFALMPYVLWAFGTIQLYETAQTIAIVIGVILLPTAFFFEIRTAALSARIK